MGRLCRCRSVSYSKRCWMAPTRKNKKLSKKLVKKLKTWFKILHVSFFFLTKHWSAFYFCENSTYDIPEQGLWSLTGKPLCFGCLYFALTQVLPVEGRLAQELRETSDIPKAQVGSLTRQRVHTMGCIPAEMNNPPPHCQNSMPFNSQVSFSYLWRKTAERTKQPCWPVF